MNNNITKQITTLFTKTIPDFTKQHAPAILTGVGISGFIFTTAAAIKVTPTALNRIEEKKLDLERDELTPMEIVTTAAPCYVVPAITGVGSIACILGANAITAKRGAALATAYALSETAFKNYKDKVAEVVGEKKKEEVDDKVIKDSLDATPLNSDIIEHTGHGDTLCYESFFGRYFYSDIEFIKSAFNELNRKLLFNNYVTLNDVYAQLNLEETDGGDYLGWGVSTGGLIEIYISSKIKDNQPCVVIEYVNRPSIDPDKWF